MSKNGTLVLLKIANTGETPVSVPGQVNSSGDFSFDMIETTVKESPARAKTFEKGEHGFTFSCEAQIKMDEGAILVAFHTAAKAGTSQDFVTTSGVIGDIQISGVGLISGISVSDPKNDVRTISYSIQGSGDYTAEVIAV